MLIEVTDDQLQAAWNELRKPGRTIQPNNAAAVHRGKPLSQEERDSLIEQTMLILGELYVHRELKRRRQAVDPFQALRIFRERAAQFDEEAFHTELMTIFKSLNDIHTSYSPPGLRSKIAMLPFLVGQCFDLPASSPRYIVSHLLSFFDHPSFKPGVEITQWSGVPIQKVVNRNAEREDGPNTAAREALGLQFLTVRWLGSSLPPDEQWVIVRYRELGHRDGDAEKEIRFEWKLIDVGNELEVAAQAIWQVRDQPCLNPRMQVEHSVRRAAFAAKVTRSRLPTPRGWKSEDVKLTGLLANTMPNVSEPLNIRTIRRNGGPWLAHIRIRHFVFPPVKEFVEEIGSLLRGLQKSKRIKGAILDLRENSGGFLGAAESLLQVFSNERITPIDFAIVASTFTQHVTTVPELTAFAKAPMEAIANRVQFEMFSRSVDDAVGSSGSVYSRCIPLTQQDLLDDIKQECKYLGPLILITGPLTYSAGEVFAAGFEDHSLGKIIGTGETTGGGGATLRTHEHLVDMLPDMPNVKKLPQRDNGSPLVRYAVARITRVNDNTGVPIEDIGVPSPHRHWPREQDVLGDNEVLLGLAMDMLLDDSRARNDETIDETTLLGIRGVAGIEELT